MRLMGLDELHQDAANARIHSQKNLQAIADSLKQFGQVEPLVVQKSTGKVVGGNGRLEAMRSLGWTQAHVAVVDLTDTKATALGIALNRTAEIADWDYEVLSTLLKDLNTQDIDLAGLGFDFDDLSPLLAATWGPGEHGGDDLEDFDAPGGGGDDKHGNTGPHQDAVSLTPEVRDLFDRVKDELQAQRKDPSIGDRDALVLLCELFLNGTISTSADGTPDDAADNSTLDARYSGLTA